MLKSLQLRRFSTQSHFTRQLDVEGFNKKKLQNFIIKSQTVPEKTVKNFWGSTFFCYTLYILCES